MVLEDKLIDQGLTDAEIAEKLAEAKRNMEAVVAVEVEAEGGASDAPLSGMKVSDTQMRQIAARKEKQMEMLRAALHIEMPELNEGREQDKDLDLDADEDKDVKREKRAGGDAKAEKIDLRKTDEEDVFDGLKHYKTQDDKKRRHGDYSSDSDSSPKHVRPVVKKYENVKSKTHKSKPTLKTGRHDSEDEMDSESGREEK
ncbi:hypothetical protein RJ641_023317 [Dillenia turbinata]|uniref:CWF21 domain-containing protein n=1 Tax=Dillenia turbinata TaxID=194707 RepID=A0AAN8UE94_9MAGN